jgi:hypothetical protein
MRGSQVLGFMLKGQVRVMVRVEGLDCKKKMVIAIIRQLLERNDF